jgi:head-tail adaptor
MDITGTDAWVAGREVLAATFTEGVTITTRELTVDDFGGYTMSEDTTTTVSGSVGELSGSEAEDAYRLSEAARWAVSLPYGTDVPADATITVRGTVCEVVDVRRGPLQVRVFLAPGGDR